MSDHVLNTPLNFGIHKQEILNLQGSWKIHHMQRKKKRKKKVLQSAKWEKAFKNGPSKICGRSYLFKFFKGCLPQILLGLFLNTLPQI